MLTESPQAPAPPASPAAPSGRRVGDLVVLAALVVLLAFLWGRGRHVWYWLDEGISVGISSHSLGEIPQLLRQDGAPPLYYVLLHGWMKLFGSSEAATHLLSVLFALASVPVAFWAGSSLFGRRAGWMAVALVAVNPFVAGFANETRMYTLVVLLGLVATACLLHGFVFRRRRYLPAFAVSFALLLYTHNWALLYGLGAAVAVVGCVALNRDPTDRRRAVVDALLAFGAAGLLYLPWLPSLLYQIGHTGAPFSKRPTLQRVRGDLIWLFGQPEAVVALGLGSGAAFVAMFQRRPWARPAVAVLAAASLAAVVVGAGWLTSRDESIWVARYLAVILGPLLLALAVGLADGGAPAVAAVAVVAFLFGPIDVKGQPFAKSNVKEVADELGPLLAEGDLVVTDFGRTPVLAHYLPDGLRWAETTGPVPDPRASDQREGVRRLEEGRPEVTVAPLLDAVPAGGHVLVVCSGGEPEPDATEFIELIVTRCDETVDLVSKDPRFDTSRYMSTDEEPFSPVAATLFTKRGG